MLYVARGELRVLIRPQAMSRDCDHGIRVDETHLASEPLAGAAAIESWLRAHKAEIDGHAALALRKLEPVILAADEVHAETFEQAVLWFESRGKKLPDAAYTLTKIKGVMTYPARDELEATVIERLKKRVIRGCVNRAWNDIVLRARPLPAAAPRSARG
jgi:hypothetical protein